MTIDFSVDGTELKRSFNKEEISKKVVEDYTKYDESRQTNLEQSNSLINEIFFKNKNSYTQDKNEEWKSKIRMCKCFMFYQTLKAFIWRNIYSNITNMNQEYRYHSIME